MAIAVLQYTANAFMAEKARYILLLIGTCYGTWRGGKKAGIFALVMSGLIGAFFLTHQEFSLVIHSDQDSISLLLYLIVGSVIIVFGEALRKERLKGLDRERELLQAQNDLAEANAKLESLLHLRQKELTEIKRFVADEELLP